MEFFQLEGGGLCQRADGGGAQGVHPVASKKQRKRRRGKRERKGLHGQPVHGAAFDLPQRPQDLFAVRGLAADAAAKVVVPFHPVQIRAPGIDPAQFGMVFPVHGNRSDQAGGDGENIRLLYPVSLEDPDHRFLHPVDFRPVFQQQHADFRSGAQQIFFVHCHHPVLV